PPANIQEIGGKQELIQLWVNVPKEHKRDLPTYFPLTAEETPTFTSEDGLTKIQVVAGNVLGMEGKAPALSPLNALTIYMEEKGTTSFTIPASHHSFLYVLGGNITVNNTNLNSNELAVFNNDGTQINMAATAKSKILFCSGEPINEPVVAHGPFVMNTETEILEAIRDYQMGKMGVLIEE
ncbi:MAG: pirin family protein, partial [Chitinophagaceae bacterium]